MTNPKPEYKSRGILTNQEIDLMLDEANKLPTVFFQLRAKALICLVKKFGKRRSEIARLTIDDLKPTETDLEITFTLSKKHKRGLYQYLKSIEKEIKKGKTDRQYILNLPFPEIKNLHKEWQQTELGHNYKDSKSLHSISLSDKYAMPILEYLKFLKKNYPSCRFFFPSGLTVFGTTYLIYRDKHLSGSQLLRIIKPLKHDAWLHLFRETKGAEIAKVNGRTLTAVYEVKEGLDLENEETAYRYVRRYATKKEAVER